MGALRVLCLVVFVAAVVCALPQNKYTTKFDNVNLDAILRNDRLLNNYFRCLMDQGSCTPDGDELKSEYEPSRSHTITSVGTYHEVPTPSHQYMNISSWSFAIISVGT